MPASPACSSPYRVLDLTDARAGLGPMVLAGLGADVIKVEPPGGSDVRRAEPLVPGLPDSLASLRLHAFDRGKRSVVLDLDSARGRADFLALVATADFVIENAGPGAMDARGLGFAALREVRPDLVYVAISPFGQDGPYAHHLATDLTLSAMGGMMSLLGEPDRRPVRITRAADLASRGGRERARRARCAPAQARRAARRSSSTSRCRRRCSGPVSTR